MSEGTICVFCLEFRQPQKKAKSIGTKYDKLEKLVILVIIKLEEFREFNIKRRATHHGLICQMVRNPSLDVL